MLVYGDPARGVATGPAVDRLRHGLAALERMSPGLEHHQELVALFIDAAILWQGVADAEFEARGDSDDLSPAQEVLTRLALGLAGAVAASWQSGFRTSRASLDGAMRAVAAVALPPEVVLKLPEGYAFYGVYPEAYGAAATVLRQAGPVRVVGIRSIGTGMSAMIAAATGAPPPVTVRPVGPPFRRELSVSPRLVAALTRGDATIAIADEGPGLSGSSFGAVADLLEDKGVAPERIQFFPSHAGDLGPEADPRHRQRWATAARHVLDFEDLLLRPNNPAHRLQGWIEDLTGPLTEPLADISAGGWRGLRFRDEADWPAANLQQERRKFLARTERGTFLVKFAGLGREGLRRTARGQALAAAGFSPEILGFRHGFLVERWVDGRPLDPKAVDRGLLVDSIGRYLAFRSRHFWAEDDRGASLAELWTMARHNTEGALGPAAAARLDAWRPDLARLQSRVSRVEVDGRLHAAEWLVLPDGRFIKTDALDHHASHDLVGCQDIAWDIAGASAEMALSDDEEERLCRIVAKEASGPRVGRDLVSFYRPCYLAFQLGALTLGAGALAGSPEEPRLRRAASAYAERLQVLLG